MVKMTNRVTIYIPRQHYAILTRGVENLSQVCGGCTCSEYYGVFFAGARKIVEPVTTVSAWYVGPMLDDVAQVVTEIKDALIQRGELGVMVEWSSSFGSYAEILE